MGWMDWIGAGKAISEPIKAVGDLYTTDKARIEAEAKLEEVLQKPVLSQIENNKLQTISGKLFESSWQPLIGWTSGACVALYYVPQLITINYIWINNCLYENAVLPFPMQPDDILNLVYLLFGFGTYHIVKKKVLGN
jgi:hypothetical protein